MTRSTIQPSHLSLYPLFLSVLLLCATFACATQSFKIPKEIEKQGQDAIKSYLDNIFSNAIFGTDYSTETGQNKEAYPDSFAIQPDTTTQIKDQGDEKNVEAELGYELNEKAEEEHRLKIPSDLEKQGQDEIKKYLDNVFSNIFLGTDSTETGQNQEAQYPNTHSIELDTKTQINHEDKRNKESDKSSYEVPKKQREEELVDGDIAVNVDLEIVGDGDYVLKIKRVNPSSSFEDEVERAKRMAQNGAMLLLYGEMLQDMGEKLLAQSQASVYSVFKMPVPPKLKSDQ